MFFGCSPCCGNICDRPYDISPTSVDIAATFSFFQGSRTTHRNNTLAEISHTYTFDGTIGTTVDSVSGYWGAQTILGSWQQTVYDAYGTADTAATTASLGVDAPLGSHYFRIVFSSGNHATDVLQHYVNLVHFPCGGTGPAAGLDNRELWVQSRAVPRSTSASQYYQAENTFFAGDIDDSWSTTNTGNIRVYRNGSVGEPPDSLSLLTEGELTNISYYQNYPTSGAVSYATADWNHSVSITRLRIIDGNGDYFEPLFNFFSTDYTTN